MLLEPGDIAACFGRDLTSRVIRLGTLSPFAPPRLRIGPSHVAMICEFQGERIWAESTSLCRTPCLIQGKRVEGAQAHFPVDRIAEYTENGGFVDIYRLTPVNALSQEERRLLSLILLQHFVGAGLHYDIRGAVLSGTRAFQASRLFPGANLEELFCSEMVAAVVMRLNRMNHANPARYNPARLLRELVRTGKYEYVETVGPTC
ncbi:MAG: hypothetical protein KDA80_01000 [Planctomycetaceae bacterium]|nr:hypothetical protein [Planctomycetaceae bacterium]